MYFPFNISLVGIVVYHKVHIADSVQGVSVLSFVVLTPQVLYTGLKLHTLTFLNLCPLPQSDEL